MVDRLTARGQGVFSSRRGWAERIVRTETAAAYNGARMLAIREASKEWPDVKKKILATFDKRTAYDSVAVHGQVRDLNDSFIDGAGRMYLQPPARPNDREIVIPWRPAWREMAHTRPVPPGRLAAAKRATHPGTAAQRR
jgi:hypothetical protein